MYTFADLNKYDYFKNVNIDYALDSLTGVLSRANILGYAKELIKNKIPFAMAILDIDNFKLVNDNYGHKIGDECLKSVGSNLAKYVGDDGLVGRYGGDEFIILYLKGTSYNEVHDYIEKLCNEGNIVRRKMVIDDISFFVTSTIGSAAYPRDAEDFDELFSSVDKALYRGKTKGRNCFIVYIKDKHKDIEIKNKEKTSLPYMYQKISKIAEDKRISNSIKIKNMLDFIQESLQISEASMLFSDKTFINSGLSYDYNINDECLDVFKELTKENDIFVPKEIHEINETKKVVNFIKDKKIVTFIVSRITFGNKIFGYLILFEGKITRIWQEKEVALLLYMNKIIELLYRK